MGVKSFQQPEATEYNFSCPQLLELLIACHENTIPFFLWLLDFFFFSFITHFMSFFFICFVSGLIYGQKVIVSIHVTRTKSCLS